MYNEKELNMSDEPLDLEEDFDEIEDVSQFNREEGRIYESIEDELEVVRLEEIEDLIDFENDALGG